MTILTPPEQIIYPDDNGEPMSDNTLQYEWITTLKWELDALFAADPDVFVAGDLLWYPVEGDNRTRLAPDTMVVFGRPKGYRGSYMQWVENGIAPQVVFEVLSPGNRKGEMDRKRDFYERYGVEEYYVYRPETFALQGWRQSASAGGFTPIKLINGWISPRLGIRFDAPGNRELIVYRPDGTPFRTPLELRQELEDKQQELDARQQELDRKRTENEKLAAKLREMGIDPDAL
jgi:Uma2 family endonuclease